MYLTCVSLSFGGVLGSEELIYPHRSRAWLLLYFNTFSWSSSIVESYCILVEFPLYVMYTFTKHMGGLVSSSRAITI